MFFDPPSLQSGRVNFSLGGLRRGRRRVAPPRVNPFLKVHEPPAYGIRPKVNAQWKLSVPFKVPEVLGSKANHFTRLFKADDGMPGNRANALPNPNPLRRPLSLLLLNFRHSALQKTTAWREAPMKTAYWVGDAVTLARFFSVNFGNPHDSSGKLCLQKNFMKTYSY